MINNSHKFTFKKSQICIKLFLYCFILILIGCSSEFSKTTAKQNIIKTNTDKELAIKSNSGDKITRQNNSDKKIIIVAYTDSVEIYKNHSDTSEKIGYINYLGTYERLNEYDKGFADWYLRYPEWIGIIYKEDTCWIKRNEKISSKLDIDTIGDLVFLNRYGYCDFSGMYNCYVASKVFKINADLNKNNLIVEKRLELKTCRRLNDSLYLLTNDYNWIRIYNTRTQAFSYQNNGGSIEIRENENKLFFIKFEIDTVGKNNYPLRKEIPCKLIMLDYRTNKEKTLFKEKDIKKKPYTCGPDLCNLSDLVIKDSLNNLIIEFIINKMKPKPTHETDAYFYRYTVDILGNIISLQLYDTDPSGRLKEVDNDSIKNMILEY